MKPKQLPSGAWRIQVYIGKDAEGKRQFISVTNIDKKTCILEAAQIAKHHHDVARNTAMMTLGEAMDEYIKIKSNVLSPSTIRGYSSMRNNHFQPEIDMLLKNITSNVAQKAINREAVDRSPKTIKNLYGFLTAVINQFAGQEIKVTLPQQIPYEANVLTEEELKVLIRAIEGKNCEIPILLALFLGLRRSEIIALTHEDYDPKLKTLKISKAKVLNKDEEFVVKTTKTVRSNRTLSVPPYLAEKLETCIAEGREFCPMHPESIRTRLRDACKKNGLPMMRLHDLRHQNASIMLKLGIADKYAMERGGWSSNNTMKKIYQHTMSSEKRNVDDLINGYFESIAEDPC